MYIDNYVKFYVVELVIINIIIIANNNNNKTPGVFLTVLNNKLIKYNVRTTE